MSWARAATRKWRRIAARGRWNAGRAVGAFVRAAPGRSVGAIEVEAEIPVWERRIHGWAATPGGPVAAILVSVEGVLHLAQGAKTLRPDVAKARGSSLWAGYSGWSVEVDLRPHEGREITIEAYAVTSTGLVDRLPRCTTRVVTTRLAHFFSPRDGEEVDADFAYVRGVALAAERCARVDLYVEGAAVGSARLFAEPTPGVAVASIPWSGMAAFSTMVDLRRFAPGQQVSITGTVVGVDGRTSPVTPSRVVIRAPRPAVTDSTSVERIRAATGRIRVPRAAAVDDIRLVMVTHDLGLGGGQLYLTELIRQLRGRVPWPMLVVSQHTGTLRAPLEEDGVEVHCCGDFPLGDAVAYESKLLELANLVRDFGGNIVLSNTMLAASGADLARRLDLPSVLAIHESYGFDEFFAVGYPPGTLHPMVRDALHAALVRSSAVVFEADATRAMYEVEGDAPRFVTIRYGVPIDEIDEYVKATDRIQLRRQLGLRPDATVLLCMGTFEPRKSQAMLATAFAEISARHPDAVLVMVGERGDEYSRAVARVVDRLDTGDRIRLVPLAQDIRPWYRTADVLVSASDLESMPRSILEAMAYGLPVVAASAFGVSEVIEDDVTGWLFEPRDAGALGRAVDRVLGLPAHRRREVADEAARVVRETYDSSGYGAAYERLLTGIALDPTALPRELLAGA